MALQDEQQMRASSGNHSLVTVNIHSDRLPRSSLQPTARDAAALQEQDPIERQEEFKMQVLKEPKCGPMWSGLEEQGVQVGSPGGTQSSSTPTVSSHQHKALGSTCFSRLRRQGVSTICHGSLILICLCLQVPVLATGALEDQGPCIPVMDIPDGKANLSCSLLNTQNVEYIQITCSQSQGSQGVYQCKVSEDRTKEAMTESTAKLGMCNRTMILILFNIRKNYHCTFKNGNSSIEKQKVEDAETIGMTVVSAVAVLLILLILIGLYIKRNKLKNCCKNRSSKSQPSPCYHTSQAIQPPYVPAPNIDPEDDDLHSIATNGNADAATATADTHDAVPGETSINPTEDPYPSGTATVDTLLTADSESANACDSEARDYYNSISLGAEACGSAVTAFLDAEVKNELLSKYDSQKQVEMQVFAVSQQVYKPEYR